MNTSLYYCMSNTQLRRILYACGKSQKAKNKAAAILRFRKTNKQQQQVSMSGFSMNYEMTKHHFLPDTILPKFTKKTKGNLKQGKSTIKRTLNFSNLKIVEAGSLCLQGRAPYNTYRIIKFKKNAGNDYQHGARRVTGPRKRIEVSEDVPSTATGVQPAVVVLEQGTQQPSIQESKEEHTQQYNIEENKEILQKPQPKVCEGAFSCGLNQERAADPKPVSANNNNKIIARILIGVTGLICLLLLIRNLPLQYKIKVARILATAIALLPLVLVWLILRVCCRCCCKSKERISETQHQLELLIRRNNFINPNVRIENQKTDYWQCDY